MALWADLPHGDHDRGFVKMHPPSRGTTGLGDEVTDLVTRPYHRLEGGNRELGSAQKNNVQLAYSHSPAF